MTSRILQQQEELYNAVAEVIEIIMTKKAVTTKIGVVNTP